MRAHWIPILTITVWLVLTTSAHAGTRADLSGDAVIDFATPMDMPFMTVGNPGNAGEQSRLAGHGDETYYGSVCYSYRIGKFEVTTGQYTEFLNAVAATDPYGLYNTSMWSSNYACKIERTGSSGSYTYSVAGDWADRPVNWVGWGDAARFCNWLTNGRPTGAQDLATTEDGSYFLNGATSDAELLAVTRKSDALYVLPSEDEWYKAAYHKNDGVTGNYFDYPTSSNAAPSNNLFDPDPGNNASFYDGVSTTIGGPYYRTEVGEFENSGGPYGTFDMGGNLWEWNEAVIGYAHGIRGGTFNSGVTNLLASIHGSYFPTDESIMIGFRVAEVPGPATLSLLALAGLALLRRRRRTRQYDSGPTEKERGPMTRRWTIMILAVILIVTPAAITAAPVFQPLGDLLGGVFESEAYAISADGSVVVGRSRTESGLEAFRWTQSAGMAGMGHLAGVGFSSANGVSADGSVIVGATDKSMGRVPFRWTEAQGMVQIGGYGGATDVSADGEVVAGAIHPLFPSGYMAWRWTEAGGTVQLGRLPGGSSSDATGISADGAVVVGRSSSAASVGSEAFRWTEATGMVGLGGLSGETGFTSRASGVSADGSTIVGYSTSPSADYEAFIWAQASGMKGLGGLIEEDFASYATAVSADGSVVVGGTVADHGYEAFVWEQGTGMRDLKDVLMVSLPLADRAILADWRLTWAQGISDDGLTIIGYGRNPNGNTEAWLAVIPEPATMGLLALGGLAVLRRRKK